MIKKFGLFAFVWIVISGLALLAQTRTSVRYIYDEEGQLVGVIDQDNNATVFTYDAAGNLIAIERRPARGAVDIFFVDPNRGRAARPPQPGTPVTIHGIGFSAVPAENRVTFNGVPAMVDAATTTMIKTTVPATATTGPVQVTAPRGSATSRSDFLVLNISVTVIPASVDVRTAQSQQFIAMLREGGSLIGGGVIWSVEGAVGGNPRVGTIAGTGLYTAPEVLPPRGQVTVTATSVEDMTASGSATVHIVMAIGPIYTSFSYGVGRPEQLPMGPIYTLSGSYRIGRSEQSPIGPIYTLVGSYRIGRSEQLPIGPINTLGGSYRIGRSEQLPIGPIYTLGGSYGIGAPAQMLLSPIFNPGGSYTNIAITGLSLTRVARGATNLPFTVMGRNFYGATVIDFLRPGGVRDMNVTVSGLAINPDGTQITGRISVAGAAPIGARTVVVRTMEGSSAAAVTESNQLVIE